MEIIVTLCDEAGEEERDEAGAERLHEREAGQDRIPEGQRRRAWSARAGEAPPVATMVMEPRRAPSEKLATR